MIRRGVTYLAGVAALGILVAVIGALRTGSGDVTVPLRPGTVAQAEKPPGDGGRLRSSAIPRFHGDPDQAARRARVERDSRTLDTFFARKASPGEAFVGQRTPEEREAFQRRAEELAAERVGLSREQLEKVRAIRQRSTADLARGAKEPYSVGQSFDRSAAIRGAAADEMKELLGVERYVQFRIALGKAHTELLPQRPHEALHRGAHRPDASSP